MEVRELAWRCVSLHGGKCSHTLSSVYPFNCLNACEGMGKGGEERWERREGGKRDLDCSP